MENKIDFCVINPPYQEGNNFYQVVNINIDDFKNYKQAYEEYKKMTDPEYIKARDIAYEAYQQKCRNNRIEERNQVWKMVYADRFPEDEQKRKEQTDKMMDEKLSKIYDKINKIYKSMTRERTKNIVNKLDYMAHAYHNHFKLSNKAKKKNDNALISARILNNKNFPEASTLATIYTIWGNVCLMYSFYQKDPNSIFEWRHLCDFYGCATIAKNDVKKGIGCDDKEVDEAYNFLMNLSNEEIEERICNNIVDGEALDTQSPYYYKNRIDINK